MNEKTAGSDAPFIREARVTFHGLAAGGAAVGRDESGKTVFAPFAAPGEVATVQITREKTAFAHGFVTVQKSDSPARVAPFCPQFRPETPAISCGGCAWQHLNIEAQRSANRDIVTGALQRIGGVAAPDWGEAVEAESEAVEVEAVEVEAVEVEAVRGGADRFYRNKADFVVGHAGKDGESRAEIGFFARESHDVVDVATCPIQNPRNEDVLRAAREILALHPQWAFDAASGRGALRRLVSRVSSAGETLAILGVAHRGAVDGAEATLIAHLLRERVPHLVGVMAIASPGGSPGEPKLLWGRDHLLESANDLEFRVSGAAFWQVNTEMAPQMAQLATELATVKAGERALDLFCGAGFFALHLARAGAQVTGIETHRGAIRDALWNAKHNALNARFRAGDARRELARFGPGDFDLITLDPPRAGARDCLDALLKIAAQRLIYVSCDPATWARDAKILRSGGYALRRVIPFDLFPQTAHVEVVSLFERTR